MSRMRRRVPPQRDAGLGFISGSNTNANTNYLSVNQNARRRRGPFVSVENTMRTLYGVPNTEVSAQQANGEHTATMNQLRSTYLDVNEPAISFNGFYYTFSLLRPGNAIPRVAIPYPDFDPLPELDHDEQFRKAIIDSLVTRTVTDCSAEPEKKCAICITEWEKDNCIVKLPCSHEYHKDCINKWLLEHLTCPLCRARLGSA